MVLFVPSKHEVSLNRSRPLLPRTLTYSTFI